MSTKRQAGFTLLELLIAATLVSLALLLSARLLLEAQWMMAQSNREARDPVIALSLAQIRNDLQGATGVHTRMWSWSRDRLILHSFTEERIAFEKIGDQLLRQVLDRDSRVLAQRTLSVGVTSWRWRHVGPNLLEVEIRCRRSPAHQALLVTDSRRPLAALEQSHLLRVALRGRGRGRSW